MSSVKPGRVVTLGMFIIDQFEYTDSGSQPQKASQTQTEQIGGGGTYAMIGARAFLPPDEIGMIIDVGTDFPTAIDEQLRSYGDSMFLFRKGDRLTTRALNIYSGEERGFRYLTPKARISPSDIFRDTSFSSPVPPSYIHFVCSPLRAREIIDEIKGLGWKDAGLVWEPMPSDCVPCELENLRSVAREVTVISPNHLEALTLLSISPSPSLVELKSQISSATSTLAAFLSPGASAVVRSGGAGVCWATVSSGGEVVGPFWIPAVYGEDEQERVRDVTGGGNSFLGGLCAGLKLTGEITQSIMYASVSASMAIEQNGLPRIASGDGGREIWNGDSGFERLEKFRQRLVEVQEGP